MVCFNKYEFTKQCLDFLIRNTYGNPEIIIVDNGSTDGTPDKIKKEYMDKGIKMVLIMNDLNAGFAHAHNQALHEATGDIFIPINNDMIPLKNWNKPLEEKIKDKDIGIVGSKLLMPGSRNIQHAGVYFLDNNYPYHKFLGQPENEETNKSQIVPAVTGACFAIGTELFREAGGFDEAYLNGWEDIDLCLKIRKMGYHIYYEAKSVLYHYEGQTEGRMIADTQNRRLFIKRWAHDIEEWGNMDYKQYMKIKDKNETTK